MASTSTGNPKDNDKNAKTNRLALEKSSYLHQHATNPVDWYPWGMEALEKAKREQKLIFLSIGYSTCHWCHVMEKESFKNKDIAEIMNKYYVNIKVDREERPDIDRTYMAFVQAVSGHGGWPMSVFLTPDLNPISGGTYFPPEDSFNYPGFKTVLLRVAEEWKHLKSEMVESGNTNYQMLKEITKIPHSKVGGIPPVACGELCVIQLAKEFEPEYGGFGRHDMRSPKFPQPVNFNLLFHMYSRDTTSELGKKCLYMCEHTLTKMAYGGIHDHVGKGFSRYSTDGYWHVPHFEKMLYDQGQIMQSYAEAFLATGESLFAEMVDDIVTYVTRDLRHKDGGFYSAEDADSYPEKGSTSKKEGAFYVWSMAELTDLLSKTETEDTKVPLLDIFTYHFNVKPEGNVKKHQDPHGELTGKNVLLVHDGIVRTAEKFGITVEEAKKYVEKACSILYAARAVRPRPHLDDKIITAWNGLMISGLAHGGMALGNKRYIEYAADAAKFVERYLFDTKERELLRSCYRDEGDVITQPGVPIHGFLDDYAFFIRGLLDLYEASLDEHWLELAEQLQATQDRLFWDEKNSGYFSSDTQDSSVILRLKEVYDGAEPSGNSIAAGNLLRLAAYLDRADLKDRAGSLFSAFMIPLMQRPAALPQMVSALIHYHDGMTQIYIAGKRDAKDTDDLLRVIHKRLIPGRVLLLADHENPETMLFRKNEFLGEMKPQEGRATAYVCRHRTCSLPVTTPEDLADLLDEH